MSSNLIERHPRVQRGALVFAAGFAVSGLALLMQAAFLRFAKSRG